jgi:CRISPR-associated protein Csb2
MSSYLCLSVTFLDPTFHGRADGGAPEWPPSPLRLFQALTAAAMTRWREGPDAERAAHALRWLGRQAPPVIVAPPAEQGRPYRLSVPNNAMDVAARYWARGNESAKDAQPATHRTMKPVRPTRLRGAAPVSYLWRQPADPPGEASGHAEFLSGAARHLVALGWGVDLVAGDGQVLTERQAEGLPGERWRPAGGPGPNALRVPVEGTLAALGERYAQSLGRVAGRTLIPVPPLTAFREVVYRRDGDRAALPFAAFQLLTLDAARFQPYSPARQTIAVAGMLRHATAAAARAAGRAEDWVNSFVLGHGGGPSGQARGEAADNRFTYLPLPTVEERGRAGGPKRFVVGSIRRALVVGPPGGTGEATAWARRALSGRELLPANARTPGALLSLIPDSDGRLRHYVGASSAWSTVTPVVLPGYDDAQPGKAERLLRRAIRQAGFRETWARDVEVELRRVGFREGLDPATRYGPPAYLKGYPRYHVRVRWRDPAGQPLSVRGPVVLGAGRYCGLGLFAAEEER